MTHEPLDISPEKLGEICRRYGVNRLWLFGSQARGTARDTSDVDILVEFLPGRSPGLAFMTLEEELSALFDRRVDLNTPGFLSRYFRGDVMSNARQLYAT